MFTCLFLLLVIDSDKTITDGSVCVGFAKNKSYNTVNTDLEIEHMFFMPNLSSHTNKNKARKGYLNSGS